jgi:hypothetical protein
VYYWQLWNLDTGEILSFGRPFTTVGAAVKHSKNFLNNSMDYEDVGLPVTIVVGTTSDTFDPFYKEVYREGYEKKTLGSYNRNFLDNYKPGDFKKYLGRRF